MSACRDDYPPGSRVLRSFGFALLLIGGLSASAALTPAAAQTGGPTQLFPWGEDEGPESGSAPGTTVAPQWPERPDDTSLRWRREIEVDRLDARLPETIGVLEPGAGGLGLDLWAGSDRGTIERLLPLIPTRLESPTLRSLARRLLLSTALPPRDAVPASPGTLLLARAERLQALGEVDGLHELLAVMPASVNEQEPIARLRVDAALLARDRDEACRLARNGRLAFPDSPYWQEASIYCNLAANDTASAGIAIGLLRESGGGDPAFLRLAEAAMGLGPVDPPEDLTALRLAMLEVAEGQLPPRILDEVPPGLLPVLALSPAVPEGQRLSLAERASEIGAMDAETLRSLYESVDLPVEALADPLSQAPHFDGPQGRALLVRAAQTTPLPQRGHLVATALQEARAEGLELALTAVLLPQLEQLRPDLDLAGEAPDFVRALLLAGRRQAATEWLEILRVHAVRDAAARQALLEIWPMARLAAAHRGSGIERVAEWVDARLAAGTDPALLRRQEARLSLLLAALGEGEVLAWDELADRAAEGTDSVTPSRLYALRAAARADRRGETILLALILAGDAGSGESGTLALVETLAALHAIGFSTEARRLAIETAAVGHF